MAAQGLTTCVDCLVLVAAWEPSTLYGALLRRILARGNHFHMRF
jgi:hypothetical protein